jgi:hypothetical protein
VVLSSWAGDLRAASFDDTFAPGAGSRCFWGRRLLAEWDAGSAGWSNRTGGPA